MVAVPVAFLSQSLFCYGGLHQSAKSVFFVERFALAQLRSQAALVHAAVHAKAHLCTNTLPLDRVPVAGFSQEVPFFREGTVTREGRVSLGDAGVSTGTVFTWSVDGLTKTPWSALADVPRRSFVKRVQFGARGARTKMLDGGHVFSQAAAAGKQGYR